MLPQARVKLVHLKDLKRLRRAHQRADIAYGADIHLAAGQEGYGAAEVDREAALDAAVNGAVNALVRGMGLLEVGPGLLAASLLARQHDGPVPVLVALDIELDDIADGDLGLLAGGRELLERDAAFALEADIDDDRVIGDPKNAARDDGPVEAGVAAESLVKKGRKILLR
jgi:hypothetical protein